MSTTRNCAEQQSSSVKSRAGTFSGQTQLLCTSQCLTTDLVLAAPAGITRASGALVNVESAFATKSALPVAAPAQRTNALDSLKVGNLHNSFLRCCLVGWGHWALGRWRRG